MLDLVIQSHRGPYRVHFGALFDGLRDGVSETEHLIIDKNVAALYSDELEQALAGPSVLRIKATEGNKSFDRIPAYITHLLDHGIRRDHCLVAVGGGIIQDITAFIAAVLLRGVAWRFYPTTLLAQADSCIGSKSSINVGKYKNQIGTFTPPLEIHLSTRVLRSLKEADVRSGIGEMIKVHIIAGIEDMRAIGSDYPRLLADEELLEKYVYRSLEIKKNKIEIDEFDSNERLIMNYGHTFGHAIESMTKYAVPHGIAVSIGMDLANYISLRLGFVDVGLYEEMRRLLSRNYDGWDDFEFNSDAFFAALSRDKKNQSGGVSMVLIRRPGLLFLECRPFDNRIKEVCVDYFEGRGVCLPEAVP